MLSFPTVNNYKSGPIGSGMDCNSGSNCLANYDDGPDPVDGTNVCCIDFGLTTGETQS